MRNSITESRISDSFPSWGSGSNSQLLLSLQGIICSKNAPRSAVQNLAVASLRLDARIVDFCLLDSAGGRTAEMGRQGFSRILTITLNRDFNHRRIRSASDRSCFIAACTFCRADTNNSTPSFMPVTAIESEREASLLFLASSVVSESSNCMLC